MVEMNGGEVEGAWLKKKKVGGDFAACGAHGQLCGKESNADEFSRLLKAVQAQ